MITVLLFRPKEEATKFKFFGMDLKSTAVFAESQGAPVRAIIGAGTRGTAGPDTQEVLAGFRQLPQLDTYLEALMQ
jgi:hypothetical protein